MAPEPDTLDLLRRQGAESSPSLPDAINVLVNFSLEPQFFSQIEAVDPRVRVSSTYSLGAEGNAQILEGDALDNLLSQTGVLFTFRFPIEWLEKMPHLKWVQLASAGADHMLRIGIFDKRQDLLLTTASGVHEVPISEHILAMILHFTRGLDKAVRNQPLHKWERYHPDEAKGKTVCLIGYGPIARRAATLCGGLGMRVICVRASINGQQPGLDAVERFYPLSDLDTALSQSDFAVVAAPRTPQSEGMIGREQFDAMKDTAFLINISRGALVDEAALIEALNQGTIAGAGLDVVTEEPLPESSPLWDMPNVLITPHISGSTPNYDKRATELFCDNLAHYLRGEPLRNLVIRERGY
jgi:D-2-hydroxyacid dehydrogenase (NADP+)